ncbi:MAG: hypothetical protein U0800_22410 [Isosphaeraceae bacterium]
MGCTIFYVLTGAPPYAGGDIADKLRRHATTPPPDARQFRPEVPEGLSRLVRRMMAKRSNGDSRIMTSCSPRSTNSAFRPIRPNPPSRSRP